MALFSALLSAFSQDVVAIMDTNGRQLFEEARPMKATVSETAKLMTHPIEDGAVIADHRIILPIVIQLSMIIRRGQARETYQQIRQIFRGSEQLTVQTKTETYPNMYLQAIPHEEDPSTFDTITILLELVEAQFVQVQLQALPGAAVQNPVDQSTFDRGEVGTMDAGSEGSLLFQASEFIGGIT